MNFAKNISVENPKNKTILLLSALPFVSATRWLLDRQSCIEVYLLFRDIPV